MDEECIYFQVEKRDRETVLQVCQDEIHNRWEEDRMCGASIQLSNYMSYLKPEDIQTWLERDFDDVQRLDNEDEALEICEDLE